MESDIFRRLMWSGLLAGMGALASLAAHKVSTFVWRRAFREDPPE